MVTETAGTARVETASAQPSCILEVRHLTKSFGATRALADVSLTFREGEIHCLLGENGAGKSTVGKIIGGLYTSDEGEILFRGRPIPISSIAQARALGIAVVYQELSLAPDLSVRANLQLGRQGPGQPFVKLKHKQEAHEAMQVLRRLGLPDIDLEQRTGELPVATQQLIEIGKALMLSPKLVIFDEPTAMLGAVETQKFFNVLRTLRQEGTASVLITHHIEDVMTVGDHISIMRNGRLVDSFAAGPDIDEDTVLERLTGKKSRAASLRRNAPGAGQFLRIDNAIQRDGTQVSLTARQGEIVGFYGVVGCGAEKIVHGLAGLAEAQPLQFTLDHVPYRPRSTAQAFAQGVSYLPSGRAANGIFATRSIRENIILTQLAKLSKLGIIQKGTERRLTEELLQRYRVKYEDSESPITSLSGGNQQKVLLARAIARAEKMLLLEEPTIGIDIDAKHEIHECIKGLAETGVTVILLSCDLIETITLCDTVFTMYGGRVVQKYIDPVLDDQASIVSDVLGQHTDAQPTQAETVESQGV